MLSLDCRRFMLFPSKYLLLLLLLVLWKGDCASNISFDISPVFQELMAPPVNFNAKQCCKYAYSDHVKNEAVLYTFSHYYRVCGCLSADENACVNNLQVQFQDVAFDCINRQIYSRRPKEIERTNHRLHEASLIFKIKVGRCREKALCKSKGSRHLIFLSMTTDLKMMIRNAKFLMLW